jgi:hypothetical protein
MNQAKTSEQRPESRLAPTSGSAKWTPTADDYRLTARVLRATARRMTELPWWERWQYPIGTLRKYAANFEEHADLLSPNEKVSRP